MPVFAPEIYETLTWKLSLYDKASHNRTYNKKAFMS